ncbi:MAG: HAMP domain-containing protein [Deltaproteobacteria bacterium]|nr:HAMP domain-containing protein [Deltaproteobacteria bacterium]
MGIMQRVSIKTFLMGVVGLLAAILIAQSVSNFADKYGTGKEIERVDIANEMADYVIEATGYQAKERGRTVIALNSDTAVDSASIEKIHEARGRGEEALKKALTHAKSLTDGLDTGNSALRAAIVRVDTLHSELEEARKKADKDFGTTSKDYSAQEWIKLITAFIDANTEMRLAAFASTGSKETMQEALRMNLELKQAVWLVGEYAGRERAMLGNLISNGKPIDMVSLEKLNTYRAIVDINMKPILRLKDMSGIDPEIMKGVARMEEVFIGKFSETRKAVYEAGAAGRYPISGQEWVTRSSEAIDTVIDVSQAVGKSVDDRVMAELAASKRGLVVSAVFMAVICFIAAASLWVIKSKVISPMLYLNDSMNAIERTGDLTTQIEIHAEDESGQMSAAFNRMMDKFHAIIAEIHSSADQLASSSEELSASAIQIADGTKQQAAKATQVSTSAHEMSTTVIEVARNVGAAAEAAKAASAVAVTGGVVVDKTIESMNGISKNAKESSVIIASLGGRSREIGNIINVINDIADQTNLLALNAAIEAARAGEQGRGFAVVADEVRKLAEKTMGATKEIGAMIKAMQDEMTRAIKSVEGEVTAVAYGVQYAGDAGDALREIVGKVDVVTSMNHQITTAIEEQSAVTEQISGDIAEVATVVNQTTSAAHQIARASEEIAELASRLKTTVEAFKIRGAAAPAHAKPQTETKAQQLKVVPLKRQALSN